jgi:hypothetical protein
MVSRNPVREKGSSSGGDELFTAYTQRYMNFRQHEQIEACQHNLPGDSQFHLQENKRVDYSSIAIGTSINN